MDNTNKDSMVICPECKMPVEKRYFRYHKIKNHKVKKPKSSSVAPNQDNPNLEKPKSPSVAANQHNLNPEKPKSSSVAANKPNPFHRYKVKPKKHGKKETQIKTYVLTDTEREEKLKAKNYNLLLQASSIWNTQFLDEELIKTRQRIVEELSSLASQYPESSPEKKYLDPIIQNLVNKPTIQEYRNSCDKIFITWDNIEFLNNTIKINHKEHFGIKPVKVVDSRESLNIVKVEYFKRVYKDQYYKLYLKNNQVVEAVSSDIQKIRSIIEIKLEQGQKKISKTPKIDEVKKKVFPKNADTSQIVDIIINLPEYKYKFLKVAAKFLNETDRVIALDENNNLKIEEALIFIYKRPKVNFVLWENVNPSRGAYLFEFAHKGFDLELSRLVTLIKGSTSNKREKFFRNEDNFGLEYLMKKFLDHEDLHRYRWKIKRSLMQG